MNLNEHTAVEGAGAIGIAGWKLIGGLAGMGALGAGLAAVVVMCLTRPRTGPEWTVALISTVIASVCGGSAFVQYMGIQHWAFTPFGMAALLGIAFACGLPGWAVVRWTFNFIIKRQDATITDIGAELAEGGKRVKELL